MSIRNRRGETAKDVAARYDQQDIVDFLDQTGGDIFLSNDVNRDREELVLVGVLVGALTYSKAIAGLLFVTSFFSSEARDSLKDAIQGIRGILSNADRIAGKWNKEDKVGIFIN